MPKNEKHFTEFPEKTTTWGLVTQNKVWEKGQGYNAFLGPLNIVLSRLLCTQARGLSKNWARKGRSSHGPLCCFARKMRGAWGWARETNDILSWWRNSRQIRSISHWLSLFSEQRSSRGDNHRNLCNSFFISRECLDTMDDKEGNDEQKTNQNNKTKKIRWNKAKRESGKRGRTRA